MNDASRDTGPRPRIVVGVDDSPGGLAALRYAISLAEADGRPLVAVRSWALGLPAHGGRRHQHQGREHPHVVLYFDDALARAQSADFVRTAMREATGGIPWDVDLTIETPEGDPGVALVGIATAGSDILVVGSDRGQSVRHLVHGSVGHYCREHASCPVIVVPAVGEPER